MFLKPITKKGVTRLYFYESYYEPSKVKGEPGAVRQRELESLGNLEDLKKIYDDPVAHFKEIAKQRTKEQKEAERGHIDYVKHDQNKPRELNVKNIGYCILKDLYKQLELDRFWRIKTKGRKTQYNIDKIFQLMVFARILYPESKRATYQHRTRFFGNWDDFSLQDMYNSLTVVCEFKDALQQWAFKYSQKICERDMSVNYFDCTNYYFDIGQSDVDQLDDEGNPVNPDGSPAKPKLRKRGPEKNHRPDPIVSMGLLVDRNGIPLAYDLFPGNESEKLHMRPIINRVKQQFSNGRTIFVADRGLNTADNIYWLNGDNKQEDNPRDGYVYGQSVRGADAEFKSWVLASDYITDKFTDDDGNEITFIHKSRIAVKELHVHVTKPGSKKPSTKTVRVDQKQMAYYSEKYAQKQRAEREAMVIRAKDLIKHPKKYNKMTEAGSASYVLNIAFNKQTGEIVDGSVLALDEEKIKEEELYDGYYSVVTSELKLSDFEIRDIYRGLAVIEDTFKISKSDFESRPVFVWTNEHIEGHFATCFTALLLIRLLQMKLDHKFPVGKILESLRLYTCSQLDKTTYHCQYIDEILQACESTFNIVLDLKFMSRNEIRRMLKY